MNLIKTFCHFCLICFIVLGLLNSQACSSQTERSTEDPCSAIKSECLGIINQNSDEIGRVLRAASQDREPSIGDVLSSLAFFAQIEEKEEYMKAACPSTYEEYVSQRDILIMLLIGKEAIR